MMQPNSTVQHSVPAGYADQLVQLVRRWNVTAEEMLSAVGLSETAVQDPHGRLPVETFGALLERARMLTGEPGLGFYMGLQKRISMYGYLGFAAMSAGSLREALEIFVRFTPTLTTSISLRLHVEGGLASLFVEEHFDLGASRDIALINLMVGMREVGRALTGRNLDGDHVDIALAEPPYLHRFKHLVPNTRWGQSDDSGRVRCRVPRLAPGAGRPRRGEAGARAVRARARRAGVRWRLRRAGAPLRLERRERPWLSFSGRRGDEAGGLAVHAQAKAGGAKGSRSRRWSTGSGATRRCSCSSRRSCPSIKWRQGSATRRSRTSCARSTAGRAAPRRPTGASGTLRRDRHDRLGMLRSSADTSKLTRGAGPLPARLSHRGASDRRTLVPQDPQGRRPGRAR